MIGLTDEEIQKLLGLDDGDMRLMCCRTEVFSFKEGAKAQLKRVVEWGNEPCAEHHAYHTPKHQCVKCMSSMWQALLEEVKDG